MKILNVAPLRDEHGSIAASAVFKPQPHINAGALSDWTKLAVERMLACGMGVRRYCCASPDCTHSRFFCLSCKSKACSSCGLKATEQQHILPYCD